MTFIVGGNFTYCRQVAEHRNLSPADWTYVADGTELAEVHHGHTILVHDTWHTMFPPVQELVRGLIRRAIDHGAHVEHVSDPVVPA